LLADGERGAIHVRGYSLMNGLVKKEREEVFEPDGFYDTGDEGFFHEGILYLTGRLTDMIKTSGNNVAPAEVERAMLALPGVLQAHVLGVPDDARGEIVAAVVVPKAGAEVDAELLTAELRKSLSNYKVPRKLIVLAAADVPFLGSGKVDRRSLRQMLIERADLHVGRNS
jgi:acyl-CoA synthetase (AMP-forming)/AMP-acid ligase II